jgi:hypothetical protein
VKYFQITSVAGARLSIDLRQIILITYVRVVRVCVREIKIDRKEIEKRSKRDRERHEKPNCVGVCAGVLQIQCLMCVDTVFHQFSVFIDTNRSASMVTGKIQLFRSTGGRPQRRCSFPRLTSSCASWETFCVDHMHV